MDFLKTNIKFSKYHLIEENKKYYINNLKDKLKGPKKYNIYLKNLFVWPLYKITELFLKLVPKKQISYTFHIL